MNVFELTRALVDIESITLNEEAVGNFLYDYLAPLAARFGGSVERVAAEPHRFNVFAQWGQPLGVTLSTHIDTVPPFFASSESETHIFGRGACDAKGIAAAMIHAVEGLLEAGERGFGLLFVAGEERNSAGAYRAARDGRGSRSPAAARRSTLPAAGGIPISAERFELGSTGSLSPTGTGVCAPAPD